MDIIIILIILLFSAIVHEVSHGLMAERLGDSTARDMGRITLNPISHIDPYGSILLPALMYFAQAPFTAHPIIFGAAKPVPVNFNQLKPRKLGMILVSLAGPFSNFVLAIICALIIKVGLGNSIAYPILVDAIFVNLLLGTFNLIPIPPLDGSKVIAALLPDEVMFRILSWERWGFILILIFLYLGWLGNILLPVLALFSKIFGIDFGF
jgi:Zn-dependent protease